MAIIKPPGLASRPIVTSGQTSEAGTDISTKSKKSAKKSPDIHEHLDAPKTSRPKPSSHTARPDTPSSARAKSTSQSQRGGAAPSSTSIDLKGLQSLATRFHLEKAWDISDPAEASTLLQRFVDAEQVQVKKEIEALPALVAWESLVDNNFAKVDQAMKALAATCEDDSEALNVACENIFLLGNTDLDLGAVVVRHPAIIQAVKVLHCAQNPLTAHESGIAHEAFKYRPKAEFSKEDIGVALAEVHGDALLKYGNLGGWADHFTHRPYGAQNGAAIFEKAISAPGPHGELHIEWGGGKDRTVHNNPENRPFIHALELIAARHDPASLSDPADRAALESVLEQVGGAENLEFNGRSLTKVGRALYTSVEAEQAATLERLDKLPDNTESLAQITRATLLASSRDGTVDRGGRLVNPEVLDDPCLTMALRIVGYRCDLPDYNVPGTEADVAKNYFAKDPEKPGFTIENITELVTANRAYSKKQSFMSVERLANEYNLHVDSSASIKGNLDSLTAQLTRRSGQYDAAEKQLGWFSESLQEANEPKSTDPIRKSLLTMVGQSTDKALNSSKLGDWQSTRSNLAELHTALKVIDDQYDPTTLEHLNLDEVLDSLDTITRQASEAKEWRTLDMVWSILSLGIFAAVKAYKAQGSTEALDRVGSIRSEIRTLRGDPDNEISRLLTLRDTIDQQIAPNIRDDRGTEFMTFFRNHLDAEIYKSMREDLIHEVTDQLAYLEKGGASDSVNFELGAGWGAGSVAKIKLGLKGGHSVSGGDDRRVREGTSFGLTIGVSGSVGAASVTGTIGGGVKAGKTFKNVHDFVEYHQDDIMLTLMRGLPNIPESLRDRETISRALQADSASQSDVESFNYLARGMGVFSADEGFESKLSRGPTPSQSVSVSGKASIGAKAKVGASELSGGLKAQGTRTTFYKQVNLLDYLKANIDDLDKTQPRDNPKSVSIRDFPEYETIEAFRDRIDTLPTRQERIETIMDGMARVAGELGSYCQSVTSYDNLKTPLSPIYKSPLEKNLQSMKHEYQRNRGVRTRQDFVKACMLTHAHLVKALKDECKGGEFDKFDLSSFDAQYTMPRLPMSDKQLAGLRKQITKVGTAKAASFDVGFEFPNGLSGGASATLSEIVNNSNPDNDGVYLTLSFGASANISPILPVIIEGLQSLDRESINDPEKLAMVTKDLVASAVGGAIAEATIPGLDLGGKAGATVELNFIKSHGLALQYARINGDTTLGGTVEDIPVGGGASLSVGASVSKVRNLGERLGTRTITYVQTQCNGFKLAGGDWKQNFRNWCLDSSRKEQIRELAVQMVSDKSNANLELLDVLEGLGHADGKLTAELQDSMKFLLDTEGAALEDDDVARFADAFADVIVKSAGRGGLARAKLVQAGWVPE